MRTFLAATLFLAAMFCLVESVMGALLSYTAYERGQLRGIPFYVWVKTDATFIVATALLFWAGYRLFPNKLK